MVSIVATGLLLLSAVAGHMQLNYPPTFNSSNNPHVTGTPDPFLYYPYNCCGRTTPFPCRGYLSLLGTPEGAPVASWSAGSQQHYSLTGIGNHYGGSCQVGFSIDKGKTFKVATSFEGNCPHRDGGVDPSKQSFPFTVPADLPVGEAVFAWTWTNREQEFFMNCAAVTITNPGSKGNPSVRPDQDTKSEPSSKPSTSSSPDYLAQAATAQSNPDSVGNAAPSYDMGGCSCTCASAAKLDKGNQYSMGGCTCTCPQSPPPMKPGAINKRGVAYRIGEWDCTCVSQAQHHTRSGYILNECSCLGTRAPATTRNSLMQRFKNSIASPASKAAAYLQGKHRRSLTLDDHADMVEYKRAVEAFNRRPSMFFADVDDGCESPHSTAELKYPDPGPDVVAGDGIYPLALPSGSC